MGQLQGPLHLGIILLVLSTNAIAHRQCKQGCTGAPGTLLKYEPGTNYVYKLEGSTVTKLAGSSQDVAKLGLSATADISALPNCEYVLKLSDVHLTGPDGKKYNGGQDLESHPIKFNMNNGRAESDICTEKDESFTSLNIKRAVISLLQTTTVKESGSTSLHETDLFGTCPTSFDFSKSGNTLNIKKTRNLNRCAHREDIHVPFLSTPYYTQSDFQSSPLLGASLVVDQQIATGVIKSAAGHEVYEYKPLQTADSGVTVTVRTKLTLVSQANGPPIAASVSEPKSIIFEVPHEADGISNANTIIDALKHACDDIDPVVTEKGAKDFAALVHALSEAKKADILNVYAQVKSGAGFKDKDTAKKMLLDGILHSESADSVEAMAELINTHEITGLKSSLWLLRLGVVKHATRASLKSVLPILDGEPSTQAYLGIGMLAGKFCREHKCEGVPEVEQLEAKMAAPLFGGCKPSSLEAEDHLIASLKGLGNIHYLSPEIVTKLSQCAADKTVRARIRVAALDTMHSDPKKEQFRSTVVTILKDQEEDSEIRIKAYLVLSECPCGKTAAIIKEVLDHEKINQVGSFIVSHLRNIRASTNPDKADAKHHFGAIPLTKTFPVDHRKFSQNYELSYSLDSINVGASGESNVIYSQSSYIPRSVSLNLTTQLFGHAFNWLELDARTENLDFLLEKWFGPKGYFNSHEANEVLEDGKTKASWFMEKLAARYQETMRPKRSNYRSQLEAIEKKVKEHHHHYQNDKVVDLDLSMKLYGSEVGWYNFHSSESGHGVDSALDEIFGFLDYSINKAKNIDVDYKKHVTFMDGEFAYPTGLGFPLKLKTLGSSALRLKLDGKIDIPAILRDPKNADLKIQLIPSAAVELTGTISVDGTLVESGVKSSLNIHTATGSDVTIRVMDGHGIDVKVGLPVANQEIIAVKSDIVSVVKEKGHQEIDTPIKFTVQREEYDGCFDQLSPLIGLTFCGEISVPWEGHRILAPSYGPSKLSLRVEKDDSLTSYHSKIYFHYKKDTGETKFEILFDTPNSNVNRKLNILVDGGLKPKAYLKIDATSPWYSLGFDGHIVNSKKEKTLNAKLKTNEGKEYSLKAGAMVSGGGKVLKYEPILEYKAPESGSSKGLVGRKGAPKQGQQAYYVTGAIQVETTPDDSDDVYTLQKLTIHTPKSNYVIDGKITRGVEALGSDLTITYDKENIVIKGKIDLRRENNIHNYLEIISSQYPDAGISIKWDIDFLKNGADDGIKSLLMITHGPDPTQTDPRITLENYFGSSGSQYTTKNSVSYPILEVEGKIDGSISPRDLSYVVKAVVQQYSAESSLSVSLPKSKHSDHYIDYDIDFSAKVMDNGVEFQAKHELVGEEKSKFTNSLEIHPGGKYQLNAIVIHKIDPDDFNVNVEAELHLPVEPKVVKLLAGAKHTEHECTGTLKASAGGKDYINSNVEYKNAPFYSLNFHLAMLDLIKSDGQFAQDKSGLKGSASLELPRVNRLMEVKTNVKKNGPKYTGFIDACWDTSNPKKSAKIQTDTTVGQDSFDSKNIITYEDYKTQLNLKGKMTGTLTEGTVSGEADVVLPNTRHIIGKFSHSQHTQQDDIDGEFSFDLIDHAKQGANPRKLNVKLIGKNINIEKMQFDGQTSLSYHTPGNKDVTFHANMKKMPSGSDKWIVNGEAGVTGSLVTPMNVKLDSELSNQFISYDMNDDGSFPPASFHLTAFIHPENTFDLSGKVSGQTWSGEISMKLPPESPVHSIKWSTTNIIDIPHHKIKSNNAWQWDEHFFKGNGEWNKEEHGNSFKAEWESDTISKTSLQLSDSYKEGAEGAPCEGQVSASLTRDGQTSDITVKGELAADKKQGSVHVFGSTPPGGKFDVLFKSKVVHEGHGVHSDISITVKDKKITGSSKIEMLQDSKLIDIVIDQPGGKSKFLWKFDKKGHRHFATEMKVKWTYNEGGSLTMDAEVNYGSIDNFLYKVNVDSPKLNIDKMHLDISSRAPAGKSPGKKIIFSAKSGDKVLFSGSTTYNYKESGDIKTVEGSGNIKIGEESYPLNFKATIQPVESGKKFKLVTKAGKKSLTIESKVTPNEYHVERTFCREPKECTKAMIRAVAKETSLLEYEHGITVVTDLSYFFEPMIDITLKANTKRKDMIFDQEIEVGLSNSKFKYNAFVHENKAGVILTLPKRTVAAEVNYETPIDSEHGSLKIDGSLWLDKVRSPNKRTHVVLNADVTQAKDTLTYVGEASFSHPSLSKEFTVKGKTVINQATTKPLLEGHAELDIFKETSQAIKIDYKITRSKEKNGYSSQQLLTVKSTGCNLDFAIENRQVVSSKLSISQVLKLTYKDMNNSKREAMYKTELTGTKVYYLIKLPDVTVTELNYKMEKKDNQFKIDGTADLLGSKYKETLTIHDKLKYQLVFSKVGSEKVLDIIMGVADEGELKVLFDKKNILDLHVDLSEDNFLKSKYSYDVDNLKALYKTTVDESTHFNKELVNLGNAVILKVSSEAEFVLNNLQNSLPDTKPILASYSEQLDAMKEEIASDKLLHDAAAGLKEKLSEVFEQGLFIIEEIVKLYDFIYTSYHDIIEKLQAVYEDSMPKVRENIVKISKHIVNIMEEWLKFSVEMADILMEELKHHEDEIKAIVDALGDFAHEFGKVFSTLSKEIYGQVKEFVQNIIAQIKSLPIYETIKEKLDELKHSKMPEDIVAIYEDVVQTIQGVIPIPEVSQLFNTCTSYFKKIMLQEQFDQAEAAKQIYKEFISAVKAIIVLLTSDSPDKEVLNPENLLQIPALSALKLPMGSIRISFVKWLLSHDLPGEYLQELIYSYFHLSLDPFDHIPPFESIGFLMGGTEIITFDGRHLSFKGTCSYVLAEDYVDGNFSIVANIENGKLKTISVYDEHDIVELRHNQKVLVNGKETEYPVKQGQISAWRRPNSVGLYSKAGVLIMCSLDANTCSFKISGFYFGKLHGFLGNPNYEPYDDTTLPLGSITENTAEFGNAWKVDPSCSDVSATSHSHERDGHCTEYFTDDENLIFCYHAVRPNAFRDACDHMANAATTPEAKKAAACSAALAYTSLCHEKGVPLTSIPDECATCVMGDEKVQQGKSLTVKTPGKSADVIFVVELLKPSEELYKFLVPPLVAALSNDFKEKGISDVHFALVGFGGPKNKWPIYYTTNGKIVYNGKADKLEFSEEPAEKNITTMVDQLLFWKDIIDTELGNTQKSAVYWDIGRAYNFRPHAVKSLISIHATPCHRGLDMISIAALKSVVGFAMYELSGIDVNYVLALDATVEGHDSPVVGFSDENVYTLADAKKKPLQGNPKLADKVEMASDLCLEMTKALGGTVFSGGNFLKMKPNARKQFINVMSQRIVENQVLQEQTLECECSTYKGLVPKTYCEVEGTKEKSSPRSAALKTTKG